jgi:hypothetical protein
MSSLSLHLRPQQHWWLRLLLLVRHSQYKLRIQLWQQQAQHLMQQQHQQQQ